MALQLALGCRSTPYGDVHRRCCTNHVSGGCFDCVFPESVVIEGSTIPGYPTIASEMPECWGLIDGTYAWSSMTRTIIPVAGPNECERGRILFEGDTCREEDGRYIGEPRASVLVTLVREDNESVPWVIQVMISYFFVNNIRIAQHLYRINDVPERCFEGEVDVPFAETIEFFLPSDPPRVR